MDYLLTLVASHGLNLISSDIKWEPSQIPVENMDPSRNINKTVILETESISSVWKLEGNWSAKHQIQIKKTFKSSQTPFIIQAW